VTTFGEGILQYDLALETPQEIRASRHRLDSSSQVEVDLQRGPDQRIYVTRLGGARAIGVIEHPDSAGERCGFRPDAIALPDSVWALFFPNIIDAYTVTRSPCLAPRALCRSSDSAICAGQEVVFSDSSLGGQQWAWSFPGGTPSQFRGRWPPPVRFDSAGSFTARLVVFNSAGEDTATATIRVHPPPEARAGADVTVCAGDSVRLEASGGVDYRWSPAETIACDTCRATTARPERTTTFIVEIASAEGCRASDSLTVTVVPVPKIETGGDVAICPGDSVQLHAGGVGSAGRYRWWPAAGLSCDTCAEPLASPVATTTYHLSGTSAAGCAATDSVTVIVHPPLLLELAGDSLVCRGTPARVTARGAASYRWSSSAGPLPCPECPEQTILPETTTTLVVLARSADGCPRTDSFTVRVLDRPELAVSGGTGICRGSAAQLLATGAEHYRWSPPEGLSCIDCPDPVATPPVSTRYTVVGTSPGGCQASAQADVEVIEPSAGVIALDRGVRLLPGQVGVIRAMLDAPVTTDTLELHLGWRRGIMAIDDVQPAEALRVDGWGVVLAGRRIDSATLWLTSPVRRPIGPGDLLELRVRAFLADTTAGEIELWCRLPASACARLAGSPGQVVIDSICGLRERLIQPGHGALRLLAASPNPVRDRSHVTFELPLDAPAVLELLDARGTVARTLAQGVFAPGVHSAMLDAGELPAGVYELRLRCAGATRSMRVVVIR
jgi:PKD repeat protein